MEPVYYTLIALIIGFLLDQFFGDPAKIPHPIVGFGKLISFAERQLNDGSYSLWKGAWMTIILVSSVFVLTDIIVGLALKYNPIYGTVFITIILFYSLSARTLRKEVSLVFEAVDCSTDKGRKQLSRIVGRDTANLEPQQIRSAALETLAENLSDGVIAPLFWFAVLGAPGMFAYKMINTLDSMIGYKTDRYLLFGRFAARLDDVANYVPARLTGIIMLLVSGKISKINFVWKYGKNHTSPNSGYPEAALAAIIDCRFGGPNSYFGQVVNKPFIGEHARIFETDDLHLATRINQRSEILMLILISAILLILK